MGCLRGVLLAWMMIAALTCTAQTGGGLPDSVNTSEDQLPPPKTDTITIPADTAAGTGAGAGIGAAANSAPDSLTRPADTALFRSTPDSVIEAYKRDKDIAYANDPAYWQKSAPGKNQDHPFLLWLIRLLSNTGFHYFLYALLAAVLIYALYRIAKENKLHLFYRSGPKKGGVPGTAEGGSLLDDDLDAKIAEALQAGDHRGGTRYLFLKTLRLLDEHELIRYHAEATNHEYILQMNPHRQGKDFQFLAGAYEHVWYGDFPLNEQQFGRLLHYFQDFYKTIGNAN